MSANARFIGFVVVVSVGGQHYSCRGDQFHGRVAKLCPAGRAAALEG